MFPNDTIITEESTEETPMGNGKSFLFDFEKGDFTVQDGKVLTCSGIDAVKIWIDKVLRTEKFKFKIYETGEEDEYGVTLIDFINSGFPLDFIKVEVEREIKEALAKNSAIESVHTFEFERIKRALSCSFSVNTIYGTTTSEVTR